MALTQIQTQPAQSDRRNAANRVTASNRYYTWVLQLGLTTEQHCLPVASFPLVLKPNPALAGPVLPDAHTKPERYADLQTPRTLLRATPLLRWPRRAHNRYQGIPAPLRRAAAPNAPARPTASTTGCSHCEARAQAPTRGRTWPVSGHTPSASHSRDTETARHTTRPWPGSLPPAQRLRSHPRTSQPLTHALPPARMRPRTGCNSRAAAFPPARCTEASVSLASARASQPTHPRPFSATRHTRHAPHARVPPCMPTRSSLGSVTFALALAGACTPVTDPHAVGPACAPFDVYADALRNGSTPALAQHTSTPTCARVAAVLQIIVHDREIR
ncbi:hypothetical protein C8R46DRAFT_1234683 [Mycena filopes]|nr:hypothetical protein C8R46DRAFT_1234683 [Mycena filopes]